jgi:orotate phosphoribosyltransferase
MSKNMLDGCPEKLNQRTKDKLIEIVKDKALEFGTFVLKTGEKTNFYFDCRKLSIDSEGLDILVQSLHGVLRISSVGRELCGGYEFDAIGGPSLGADTIVGAFLYNQGRVRNPLRGFLIRKETDVRGDRVVGSVKKGDKVVIVEDVVTSGKTALIAVRAIEEFGCEVLCVISVVDRLEGAKELFKKENIPFSSMLTIDDVAQKTYIQKGN